ncbi:MAG: DNA-3-methyladenine glycosylase [Nitrososphaerota archaeon]|nr:DNA-3-methyladenine glycosylase [Nitrososphaerota archaeon]MDG7024552.1 DNA-3-methyladenine glycosylase [Nitrososphaerota archaeon]
MARLGRDFFARYSPRVAKELIGCSLVRVVGGTRLSGVVVETEAYRGSGDPASHAHRGKTGRNEVMFGPAGFAYVYFTMGAHFCLNVTTERTGIAAAVLIRAVQPMEGMEEMGKNRGVAEQTKVASGPGNLTKAFGVDRRLNGEDMVTSERLFFEAGQKVRNIGASSRVGVSAGKSFRWRFYVKGNPFVSKGRPSS